MEAIYILFAYNLCLGFLSSAVLLGSASEPIQEPVKIKSQSLAVTECIVERMSEEMKQVTLNEIQAYENLSSEIPQTEIAEQEYEEQMTEQQCDLSETVQEEEYSEDARICFSEDFDSSFKAYMDYRCITDTSSVQYSLQQQAYTDERGFRRIGNDYCVALGTGITSGCGERFVITLDSGYSFSVIVSDIKADAHTDSTNCYAPRGENAGNIVEFIIDTDNADGYMLTSGSAGCFDDLSGNVISIEKI